MEIGLIHHLPKVEDLQPSLIRRSMSEALLETMENSEDLTQKEKN